MCHPAVLLVASAAMTAIGGYQEARAQRQAGDANAQIMENNARLAEAQAKDVQVLAVRDQEQSAWRTRALIGKQKVAAAASGLDMDIGNTADIMGETAMFGQADEDAIAADAARKAWGFNAEATNYRNQGAQAKWQGRMAGRATILKTIGSVGSQVAGGFQSGAFKMPGAGGSRATMATVNSGSGLRGYA